MTGFGIDLDSGGEYVSLPKTEVGLFQVYVVERFQCGAADGRYGTGSPEVTVFNRITRKRNRWRGHRYGFSWRWRNAQGHMPNPWLYTILGGAAAFQGVFSE